MILPYHNKFDYNVDSELLATRLIFFKLFTCMLSIYQYSSTITVLHSPFTTSALKLFSSLCDFTKGTRYLFSINHHSFDSQTKAAIF